MFPFASQERCSTFELFYEEVSKGVKSLANIDFNSPFQLKTNFHCVKRIAWQRHGFTRSHNWTLMLLNERGRSS